MPMQIYKNVKTTLSSSIVSTVATGQGLVMDFSETVPTENANILYLQSGNLDEFIKIVSPPPSLREDVQGAVAYNVVDNLFDMIGERDGGYGNKHGITKKSKKRSNKHMSRRKY
jgi:hypothetical protein